jgi:Archaeal adenylate kinase
MKFNIYLVEYIQNTIKVVYFKLVGDTMFIGVCPKCGKFDTKKSVETHENISYSICEECGNSHEFNRLPLFVVIGSSGSGKTSVCLEMSKITQDFICLDGDIFLAMSAATNGNWDDFRYLVMEICANISQYGKPVALFHSGMPDDYTNNKMAKFFDKIVTIGIYADENVIVERLSNRPKWRQSSSTEFIERMIGYNKAVSDIIPVVNTTDKDSLTSAKEILEILKSNF